MTENIQPTTWQLYRSLALSVYAPTFLMSICQSSVVLVIPLFALDLGSSAAIAALVFAMRGLGNIAMDVPAGYCSARLGDKFTMLLGVVVMSLTGFAASYCTTPLELGLAAFCFGGAMATWMLARLTHISEAVHVSHRGKAISTMAGLARFGHLLGPLATGLIADQFGFPWVFLFISTTALLALLMVIVFVGANKKSSHEDSPGIVNLIPHIISQHWRVFLTAGTAMLFLTLLRSGRGLLIPLWGAHIDLTPADIGLIVSLAAAVDMIMFPAAGYLLDNRGRKHSAVICMVLLSLGILAVPWTATFTGLLLAAMLAGMGNGFGSGINMTLGADFAPAHERGEFLGVWRLIGDLGSFAGPLFMGYVAHVFLLAATFSVTALLGLTGAIIMAVFVRETLQQSRQNERPKNHP